MKRSKRSRFGQGERAAAVAVKQSQLFIFFILLPAVLCFSLLFVPPHGHADNNADSLASAKIDDKLDSIKKRLDTISENQKKITEKNEEIKSELDSLGVWIRRG